MSNRTVPQFAIGELINVQIRGARVEDLDCPGNDTFATLALGSYRVPIALHAPGVTVERVAPAEWPPQRRDRWKSDGNGWEWFAVESTSGAIRLVNEYGDSYDPHWAMENVGPMRLLDRDGWTPAAETAPAEAGPGRVLTESEKRAEMIAGLRELADLLEARPDLYFDHGISMCTTYEPDPRGEVERWADVLGVTTAHEKAGGNIHHRAVGNVRGLSLFVVTIEKPEPAAVQPDEPVEDDPADTDPEAPAPAPQHLPLLRSDPAVNDLPHRTPDPDAASLLAESLADGAA